MLRCLIILFSMTFCLSTMAADVPAGAEGYNSHVKGFFNKYCIECHGPKKSKGKITLHTLDGDLSQGIGLKHWESVLEVLAAGEMPPEDEKQPDKSEAIAVAGWIDRGLREYVENASSKSSAPTVRRLTNFEYENTIRDLLGFELKLIDNLPEDPVKPYKFNNSATFMLMGMEQLDRYKENARLAMASAIVDPAQPKIHKTLKKWEASNNSNPTESRYDEIGGRRGSPGGGMGLKSWPEAGEFLIRVQAAGIFPEDVSQIPLRLVMGYALNRNQSTLQVEHVGTVTLTNNVDNLQTFEFRGRVENFPSELTSQGKGKAAKLIKTMFITPQNIFDDGRRMDNLHKMKRPRIVIKSMEFEAPVFKKWPPRYHTDIMFESSLRQSNPSAYIRDVIEKFMTRAFRRPVNKEEVDRYVKIYDQVKVDFPTMEGAVRETLAMVLISPDFMYHLAVRKADLNKHYAIASKISYFLWGSMPDKELFDLAAASQLTDPEVVEKQVLRMLKDAKAKDFVRNFTMQWLSIEKMKQVAINRDLFPRFLYLITAGERSGLEVPYIPTVRDYMLDETVGFIGELIKRNASVLNVVDSDFAYLNQRLAAHYGVEGVEGHKFRPVSIKPEHNIGGLLTHASVLIGNSTGSAPHPIYRAVWLRDAILGDHVKDPPAEVPALADTVGESAEKALSIKDLLEKHRQVESCNDCHVRLDPWGIPFEQYNAIGKYQPMVPKEGVRIRGLNNNRYKETESFEQYQQYLQSVFTEKIEAQSRVPHGPKVSGMKDLKKHLLKDRKKDIAANVVRKLMTYAIGRELTFKDRYVIEKITEKMKDDGYKFQNIIVAVCKSETFLGDK